MVKLAGAVLIVASTSLLGFGKVFAMKNRRACLTALLTSLEMMQGEICTRRTPLPELSRRLSEEAPKEARRFFSRIADALSRLGEESFARLWAEAVRSSKELCLSEDESRTLEMLGHTLGRFDVGEQEAAISLCIRKFELFLKKAGEDLQSGSKLYAGLGIAAGVLLAVLMY